MPGGGNAWQGGMCGRGMCDRGFVWQGHVWQGVCVAGSMHGSGCTVQGRHAWQGACVAGVYMAGGMHGRELLTLSFIHNHSILFVIIMKDKGPKFLNLV